MATRVNGRRHVHSGVREGVIDFKRLSDLAREALSNVQSRDKGPTILFPGSTSISFDPQLWSVPREANKVNPVSVQGIKRYVTNYFNPMNYQAPLTPPKVQRQVMRSVTAPSKAGPIHTPDRSSQSVARPLGTFHREQTGPIHREQPGPIIREQPGPIVREQTGPIVRERDDSHYRREAPMTSQVHAPLDRSSFMPSREPHRAPGSIFEHYDSRPSIHVVQQLPSSISSSNPLHPSFLHRATPHAIPSVDRPFKQSPLGTSHVGSFPAWGGGPIRGSAHPPASRGPQASPKAPDLSNSMINLGHHRSPFTPLEGWRNTVDEGWSRKGVDEGWSRKGVDEGWSRKGVDEGWSRKGVDEGWSRKGIDAWPGDMPSVHQSRSGALFTKIEGPPAGVPKREVPTPPAGPSRSQARGSPLSPQPSSQWTVPWKAALPPKSPWASPGGLMESWSSGLTKSTTHESRRSTPIVRRYETSAAILDRPSSMDYPRDSFDDDLIPTTSLIIKKQIAEGSFGTVYLGQYQGETVAIKKAFAGADGSMTVEQLRNFNREIAAYRVLGHPYIPRFIGTVNESGFLGVVTEYVEGENLFDFLFDDVTPLDASQRLKLAIQTAEVLMYLHTRSPPMIHRDIKTANLLLDKNTLNMKLCDFGKTREAVGGYIVLDDNGGSPRYMAPECFKPGGRVHLKADVWSTSCCLIEILGGPVMFEQYIRNEDVIREVLDNDLRPEAPYWFHPTIRALLNQCFDPVPESRPSSSDILEILRSMTPADLDHYGMSGHRRTG